MLTWESDIEETITDRGTLSSNPDDGDLIDQVWELVTAVMFFILMFIVGSWLAVWGLIPFDLIPW